MINADDDRNNQQSIHSATNNNQLNQQHNNQHRYNKHSNTQLNANNTFNSIQTKPRYAHTDVWELTDESSEEDTHRIIKHSHQSKSKKSTKHKRSKHSTSKRHKHRKRSRRYSSCSSSSSSDSSTYTKQHNKIHIKPDQQRVTVKQENDISNDNSTPPNCVDPELLANALQLESSTYVPAKSTQIDNTIKHELNNDSDSDDSIGPQRPNNTTSDTLRESAQLPSVSVNMGHHLLPGEGAAALAYIQSGQRIPRRGEIGLSSDEISNYERQGFVMSGSRHARMNAVRIRKENQLLSAAEQAALDQLNIQEKLQRANNAINQFKQLLDSKHKEQLGPQFNQKTNDTI